MARNPRSSHSVVAASERPGARRERSAVSRPPRPLVSVIKKQYVGREVSLDGYSSQLLADTFGMQLSEAARWKRRLGVGRVSGEAARLVGLLRGDLGFLDPEWAGWILREGLLYSPEGSSHARGDVYAIPHVRAQLQEYERAQRWMIEQSGGERRQHHQLSQLLDAVEKLVKALRGA